MWHVVLSGAGVPYQGKAPLFSANYQFYVRTLSHRAGQRGPLRQPPTRARARAPSRAPLDVRFSGSASVRACVQNIFRLKLGRLY